MELTSIIFINQNDNIYYISGIYINCYKDS